MSSRSYEYKEIIRYSTELHKATFVKFTNEIKTINKIRFLHR